MSPMAGFRHGQPQVRLAEMVGALCIAADMAMGQPLEHGMRRALLAVWLGREMGLGDGELSSVLYVSLLGDVGCAMDGAVMAKYVDDDIAVGAELAFQDPSKPISVMTFFAGKIGAGEPPWRRVRKLGEVLALGPNITQAIGRDIAVKLGEFLGLGSSTRDALGHCMETWNGSGGPSHLKGEAISVAARLFALARDAEIYSRAAGVDSARAMVRERSGRVYDPNMAARFLDSAPALLARLNAAPAWDAMLSEEPIPVRLVDSAEIQATAEAIANFVDLRSRYTLGHSTGVGRLALSTATSMGLPDNEAAALGLAGLLHDLGRCGVPVAAWDREGPLPDADWDRMKRHPSLTELALARSTALAPLGTVAALHHERLDGSGYRGVSASSLPLTARILATADTYQTKLEPRPHREPLTPEQAAAALKHESALGRLDADTVAAALTAAGQSTRVQKKNWPDGLTDREVEVLRLAVKGHSNRKMAQELVVSPKTIGHHLESIYSKIGVSTRVGATLFALQHRLIES